jgi:hypothetical protein
MAGRYGLPCGRTQIVVRGMGCRPMGHPSPIRMQVGRRGRGALMVRRSSRARAGVNPPSVPSQGSPVSGRGGKDPASAPPGMDGPVADALLRAGRFFQRGQESPDLRAIYRVGGREGDVFYRDRWSHDKVVRSTHGVNCTGSCSWKVYVKDGIITWETQETDYPSVGPDRPEYEPGAVLAARRSPGTPTRPPGSATRTRGPCCWRCTGRPDPGSAIRSPPGRR